MNEHRGPYFVVVVQHGDQHAAHVVPGRPPTGQPGARLILRAGPFHALARALESQRRVAQEWHCRCVAPEHDTFGRAHWGPWPEDARAEG